MRHPHVRSSSAGAGDSVNQGYRPVYQLACENPANRGEFRVFDRMTESLFEITSGTPTASGSKRSGLPSIGASPPPEC